MSKDRPYLPLFIGDYLADTPPVSRPTWEHHGIYLLLLMLAWRVPQGRLPDDESWLALHMGCDEQQVRDHVTPVLEIYFKSDGSWWRQKRLSREFKHAATRSQKGRSAAKSRWDNKNSTCERTEQAHAKPSDTHKPNDDPGKAPNPTQPNPLTESDSDGTDSVTARDPPVDPMFDAFWSAYPRHAAIARAIAAWKTATQDLPDGETEQTIIDAAARFAATQRDVEQRFVPMAHTWLGERRWRDTQPSPEPAGSVTLSDHQKGARAAHFAHERDATQSAEWLSGYDAQLQQAGGVQK